MDTKNWKPEFYFLQEQQESCTRICYSRKGYIVWGNHIASAKRSSMQFSKVGNSVVEKLVSFAVCEERASYSVQELFLLREYLIKNKTPFGPELAFYYTQSKDINEVLAPYNGMSFPLVALICDKIIDQELLSSIDWRTIPEDQWGLLWYNRKNPEFIRKFLGDL